MRVIDADTFIWLMKKYFKGLVCENKSEVDILECNAKLHEIIDQQATVKDWIPVDERYPDTDDYILLSFSNFSVPVVGRWEEDENGGAFYVGDDEESCVSHGLFVNAWRVLPKPYREE